MPSLDLAMPLALFLVVLVAMVLNKRVSGKLSATIEEREFKTRDIILLVAFIAIMVSVIAVTTMVAPGEIFQNILLIFFLSSYTMLLFTFSYVFSNQPKGLVQVLSVLFGVVSLIAGFASLFGALADGYTIYRVAAFFSLAIFCFGIAVYEQTKPVAKARWYLAAQPPALFVLLFVFFNILNNPGTIAVWTPFLMDVFGLTFAILIILYLSPMFNWKTVGLFAVLLTVMDIILVIGTSAMITAAQSFTGLGLPVLIRLPNVPFLYSETGALLSRGLGLGDFFFAGVLAVQTYNKFGKKTALISAVAMAVAFGIWEAFLHDILNVLNPIVGRDIGGFPGTLMIISGWVPVIVWAVLSQRKKAAQVSVTAQPPETPKDPNLPMQ